MEEGAPNLNKFEESQARIRCSRPAIAIVLLLFWMGASRAKLRDVVDRCGNDALANATRGRPSQLDVVAPTTELRNEANAACERPHRETSGSMPRSWGRENRSGRGRRVPKKIANRSASLKRRRPDRTSRYTPFLDGRRVPKKISNRRASLQRRRRRPDRAEKQKTLAGVVVDVEQRSPPRRKRDADDYAAEALAELRARGHSFRRPEALRRSGRNLEKKNRKPPISRRSRICPSDDDAQFRCGRPRKVHIVKRRKGRMTRARLFLQRRSRRRRRRREIHKSPDKPQTLARKLDASQYRDAPVVYWRSLDSAPPANSLPAVVGEARAAQCDACLLWMPMLVLRGATRRRDVSQRY